MRNPCRHTRDTVVDLGGVLWCKECGAIYDGNNPGVKPRWKSPERSIYDIQHIAQMGEKAGRHALQQELKALLGLKEEQ